MTIPRYDLNRNGNFVANPSGGLMRFDDVEPIITELSTSIRKLQSILAAVLHEHHNGILELSFDTMNELARQHVELQVAAGENGQELVLRVIDAKKA